MRYQRTGRPKLASALINLADYSELNMHSPDLVLSSTFDLVSINILHAHSTLVYKFSNEIHQLYTVIDKK